MSPSSIFVIIFISVWVILAIYGIISGRKRFLVQQQALLKAGFVHIKDVHRSFSNKYYRSRAKKMLSYLNAEIIEEAVAMGSGRRRRTVYYPGYCFWRSEHFLPKLFIARNTFSFSKMQTLPLSAELSTTYTAYGEDVPAVKKLISMLSPLLREHHDIRHIESDGERLYVIFSGRDIITLVAGSAVFAQQVKHVFDAVRVTEAESVKETKNSKSYASQIDFQNKLRKIIFIVVLSVIGFIFLVIGLFNFVILKLFG